jgi:hypothetical protein
MTRRPSPYVAYTAGRIGVFVAVAAVLYLIGFRTWMLVLVSILLSMPLSYVVLARQRIAMAKAVEERLAQRRKLRAQLRGDDS